MIQWVLNLIKKLTQTPDVLEIVDAMPDEMTIGTNGLNLIKSFEGFEPRPYIDAVGVPTIGYGTTIYPSGRKVKIGDKPITEETAILYLMHDCEKFEKEVRNALKNPVNQNQFDALVSLTYNIGATAFKGSTVLKRVNANPADKTIKDAFLMWVKGTVNGKKVTLKGLVRRREAEAKLYFTKP